MGYLACFVRIYEFKIWIKFALNGLCLQNGRNYGLIRSIVFLHSLDVLEKAMICSHLII